MTISKRFFGGLQTLGHPSGQPSGHQRPTPPRPRSRMQFLQGETASAPWRSSATEGERAIEEGEASQSGAGRRERRAQRYPRRLCSGRRRKSLLIQLHASEGSPHGENIARRTSPSTKSSTGTVPVTNSRDRSTGVPTRACKTVRAELQQLVRISAEAARAGGHEPCVANSAIEP